jgi:hypothetical protein
LYAEAARPGGKLVEAVDESVTGSVYSFPTTAHSAPFQTVGSRNP